MAVELRQFKFVLVIVFYLVLLTTTMMVAFERDLLIDSDTYRILQTVDAMGLVSTFTDLLIISSGKVVYLYLIHLCAVFFGDALLVIRYLQGFILFLTGVLLFAFLKKCGIRDWLNIPAVTVALFVIPFYKDIVFTTTFQAMGNVFMLCAVNAICNRKRGTFIIFCLLSFFAHPYFVFSLLVLFISVYKLSLKKLCLVNILMPIIFAAFSIDISEHLSIYFNNVAFFEEPSTDYIKGFRVEFYLTILTGVVIAVYVSTSKLFFVKNVLFSDFSCVDTLKIARASYKELYIYVCTYLSLFTVYPAVMNFAYHDRFLQTGWFFQSFVMIFMLLKSVDIFFGFSSKLSDK